MKSGLFNTRNVIAAIILIMFIFAVYNHISLNQANNKLKVNSIELEDRIEVLDTQLKALHDAKLKCQRRVNALEIKVSDVADLKKKISDMKSSQDAQTSALSKENESLKSQLQQLQNDYKQLSEKSENLEANNQKLTKDKESEISQLKTEHENEISRLKDEIANLKRTISEPPNTNTNKKTFVKKGGDDKDSVNEQINPPKDPQKMKESYEKLGKNSVDSTKNDAESQNNKQVKVPDSKADQAPGPEVPKVDDRQGQAQAPLQKASNPLDSSKLDQSNSNNVDSDPDKKVDDTQPGGQQHQNILPKPDDEKSSKPRRPRNKRNTDYEREDLEPRKKHRQRILDEGNVNLEDAGQYNPE